MISRNYLLIMACTTVMLGCWSLCSADKLSIDQAVGFALRNNPGIKIVKENIARTSADIDEASAEGMPHVALDWQLTRNEHDISAALGGQTIVLTPLNAQVSHVTLMQPLDVFSIIKLGHTMAKLGRVQAEYDYEAASNDLTFGVKQAFFDVLRAQENVRVRRDTLDLLKAHLADANANLRAGTISKFDVVRAETQVANSEVDSVSAENVLKVKQTAFNSVLGRDLGTPVELEWAPDIRQLDVDVASFVEAAKASRPEIKNANAQIELSRDLVVIAGRGSKPTVSFQWRGTHNFNPTLVSPRENYWDATIFAGMALYDGGATSSQVAQARSDARNAGSGLLATQLGVSIDVKQSYLSLQEAGERIRSSSEGLALAKESARLAGVRYKAGMSTQVDVLDAQTALTQADVFYVNALYDYGTAAAKLEQAVGGPVQMSRLIGQSHPGLQAKN